MLPRTLKLYSSFILYRYMRECETKFDISDFPSARSEGAKSAITLLAPTRFAFLARNEIRYPWFSSSEDRRRRRKHKSTYIYQGSQEDNWDSLFTFILANTFIHLYSNLAYTSITKFFSSVSRDMFPTERSSSQKEAVQKESRNRKSCWRSLVSVYLGHHALLLLRSFIVRGV